jgi:uncharacterized membrane protein
MATTEPAGGLTSSLQRNIAALEERRQREAANATREERIAEAITRFSGSMRFVYLHLVIFGAWVLVNVGAVPMIQPFDPTLVMLASVASVEAIFLSTFVLISQNRMALAAERRAELDLQVSLLAEHELTKLSELVSAISERLGLREHDDPEIAEIRQNVAPEAVMDAIDTAKREA